MSALILYVTGFVVFHLGVWGRDHSVLRLAMVLNAVLLFLFAVVACVSWPGWLSALLVLGTGQWLLWVTFMEVRYFLRLRRRDQARGKA